MHDTFSPIVHTKTPKNADQNGGVRQRFQKWRVLKAHRFENASFLVWTGERNSVTRHRFQSKSTHLQMHNPKVPVVFIVFEPFSVGR